MEKKVLLDNSDFIIDGEKVIVGDNRLEIIRNKCNKLRYILEQVCQIKQEKLENCEFVINLLEHPILTVREDKLINPFASSLKEQANDINIKGNILPNLGDNQMNNST